LELPGNPNSQNGVNTLYTIGDQGTAGIVKYSFNGTAWVNDGLDVALNANDVVNPTGLIAVADPSNPNYVDLTVSGTNGFYTYEDTNGPTGAIPADAFALAASAPTNEAFYGIATVPVPEPATLGIVAVGAAGLLGRRSRKAV
jgi:hypothetical protein